MFLILDALASGQLRGAVESEVAERLARIESALAELIRRQEALLQKQTVKDFYTPAEAAAILGRAEYTVREWCRHGQARAQKRQGRRGPFREWIIPHAELIRLQNEGPLPCRGVGAEAP